MTPAKSVLAAILLAAVGLSGLQLPQLEARSHSSQKYDKFLSRLAPRHASKNLPSRPLHPPPRCWPVLHDTNPHHRATLRKSSLPIPFDVFCFRARQTAKRCSAAPYYYYPAYLIVLPR
ncbi:hypothetical protein EDB89DRAFT_2031249 [Lactarius sanguifluus]|nr:hypothetical protein EDB89DRAFT_2031249 [Lactarius sanguifluus]